MATVCCFSLHLRCVHGWDNCEPVSLGRITSRGLFILWHYSFWSGKPNVINFYEIRKTGHWKCNDENKGCEIGDCQESWLPHFDVVYVQSNSCVFRGHIPFLCYMQRTKLWENCYMQQFFPMVEVNQHGNDWADTVSLWQGPKWVSEFKSSPLSMFWSIVVWKNGGGRCKD